MAVTTTNNAALLKKLYPQKRIEYLMYQNNPLFAMLSKMDDFGGSSIEIAMQYADPAGRSATFATAQANKGNSEPVAFSLTRAKDYSLIGLENEAIQASKRKGNEAYVSLLDNEVMSGMRALKRSMSVDAFRDGLGVIGVRGDVTSSVLTLTDKADISNFEKNQVIVAVDGAGAASAAIRVGSITVTKVNRSAGTVTFTGSITDFADGDWLIVQGDAQNGGSAPKKLMGLAGWLPYTAPGSSDSFFGVNRSADATRLAGQRVDGSSLSVKEALIELAYQIGQEGGEPDVAFMSWGNVANLVKSLGADVRYMKFDVGTIGFNALEVLGPRGVIKVFGDQNCPGNRVYALQMNTWELHHLNGAPHIINTDSLDIARDASADSFEGRIAFYGNLACTAPGFNGVAAVASPTLL